MFNKFKLDPSSIPEDWKVFFLGINEEEINSSIFKADWGNQDDIDLPNGDLVAALDGNWSNLSERF